MVLEHRGEEGLFVPGKVHGEPVSWLVDTGCTVTLLSSAVFHRIPEDRRPLLEEYYGDLVTGNGTSMDVEGQARMPIEIDGLVLEHDIVVANTDSPGMLGLDFLMQHDATIGVATGKITLGRKVVSADCKRTQRSCSRVTLAETVVVPAGHRMVLPGRVGSPLAEGQWMVGPLAHTPGNKPLVVARSLVEAKGREFPLEVMNPTEEDVLLYKGTHTALVEPVEVAGAQLPVREREDRSRKKVNMVAESPQLPAELQKMMDEQEVEMTGDLKREAQRMLARKRDAFMLEGDELGKTNLVQHEIHTNTQVPLRQRARRLPIHQREEGERQVQDMLEKGLIEPSQSPWASPVVLVRKKDGSTRFCIDYRRLNDVTIKDAYPLPRIDESLDALSGADCFSTLDLASGYWQVGLAPAAKEKSAFVTNNGLYQFNVMPFGLSNAPSTFERLMERVLAGLQWQLCLVYLDDVIVFSQGIPQHIKRLEEVLTRIETAGLKLKPKKCHLFRRKVDFLGHVVSGQGIATNPEKIKAVEEWGTPKDLHEVRSFLGLCSYYRRFIKGFSTIAKPLTRLTEKGREFDWGQEQEEAWLELKGKLVSSPVLAYPDPGLQFILDTDASGYGIGAVLSQVQNGEERVIAYGSRTLTREERRYCVTRRELLAVVYFVKQFRHYLYGRKFLIRTDHGALRWLLNFKDPQGQVARWIEVLDTYSYEIQHRPGVRHGNADAMSRGPCRQCGQEHETESGGKVQAVTRAQTRRENVPDFTPGPLPRPVVVPWLGTGPLHISNIKKQQQLDPVLSQLSQWKRDGDRPEWRDVSAAGLPLKAYWAQWGSIREEDGVLKRELVLDGKKTRCQVLMPSNLQGEVFQHLHAAVTSGHMGVRRTLANIRARFYWVRLKEDIMERCRNCSSCAARKPPLKRNRAPLRKYVMGLPMERVALDILGPLPVTAAGNRYVLVMADYFTKWVEAIPLPDQEARTTAEAFVNNFVTRFGAPLLLHTDQGRNFEAKLFQEMGKLLGIKKTRTTAYRPQSDGLVERFNRTLITMVTAYAADHQRTWDKYLPMLTMAYRSTPQESSGLSPNQLMLGREVNLPIDILMGQPPETKEVETNAYAAELRERMEDAFAQARANQERAAERQKQYYDVKTREGRYRPGDTVWILNKDRRKGVSPKLQKKWKGPMLVEDCLNDVTYRLRVAPGIRKVVHFDMLKPYADDDLPRWMEPLRQRLQGRRCQGPEEE